MSINLLVALQAEAKPLIAHFRLKGLPPIAGFRCYGNDQINLLVTGVGGVAMAAGVMAQGLAGLSTGEAIPSPVGWINIGIAGHQTLPLGSLTRVGKITDHGSGLCWYPPQVLETDLLLKTLLTVASPLTYYPQDQLVDMEASGFFVTACRFAVGEAVQLVKVVSDNQDTGIDRLDGSIISQLIEGSLTQLDQLIGSMQQLLSSNADGDATPTELETFLLNWRFSKSQQFLLGRLLRDHRLLTGQSVDIAQFSQVRRSADLLISLGQIIGPLRRGYKLPVI